MLDAVVTRQLFGEVIAGVEVGRPKWVTSCLCHTSLTLSLPPRALWQQTQVVSESGLCETQGEKKLTVRRSVGVNWPKGAKSTLQMGGRELIPAPKTVYGVMNSDPGHQAGNE